HQYWQLAHGKRLELGARAIIMGVLNVTPDSFTDGGQFLEHNRAIKQGQRMLAEGAQIIDVGGESTRPDAKIISEEEEQTRILSVIKQLAQSNRMPISVDTYHVATAKMAIDIGAHIINDVWGLHREAEIADVAAYTGAGLIVMHTGREREKLADIIEDQVN